MREQNKQRLILGGGTLLVMALFVGLAAMGSGAGFPLDDGWIHQTYARNFAQTGRWAYVEGVTSAGSTAPLWTLLLAVGYLLRIPYLFWAYFWGGVSLWATAVYGACLIETLYPEKNGVWAGLLLLGTWPLVWAAASGMETMLFTALALAVLVGYLQEMPLSRLGVLSGLLILTRPDGVVLLLLVALAFALQRRWQDGLIWGITAVCITIPYFAFNFFTTGNIWPNTFYAKQAEYAVLLAEPLLGRFVRLLYFSWGGPQAGWQGISHAGLLLVPGLLLAMAGAVKSDWQAKQLRYTLPLGWAVGHVLLYAWRLPVTYQHGRYLFPAVPVFILLGMVGWQTLLSQIKQERWQRLGTLMAQGVMLFMVLFFLVLGGATYANNVAFIENEMVAVAHWLAENTPSDALIASHDIGAIGFFAQRPLLDLAGLISPDVIPFINDEAQLGAYIQQQQADYLVTAPGWPYEQIVDEWGGTAVYSTNYEPTTEQGANNMTIYEWPLGQEQ